MEFDGQINIASHFSVRKVMAAHFFVECLTIVLEKGHQMMLRNVIHIFISHPISFYNCSSMKCKRETGKQPDLHQGIKEGSGYFFIERKKIV